MGKEPTRGAPFDELGDVVVLGVALRSVGEPDGAVTGDRECIQEEHALAADAVDQHAHDAIRIDGEETPVGVGHDQVSHGVECHSTRGASGRRDGLDVSA